MIGLPFQFTQRSTARLDAMRKLPVALFLTATGTAPSICAGRPIRFIANSRAKGPQFVQTTEKRVSGIVAKAVQDGRFVTVKSADGTETQLRITADTDVAGIADRTLVQPGMKLSALYQIAQGARPALGYDALEMTVAP
jgi:hypothetical protein